ncbi:MAG: hypothetical protein Q4G13_09555 [Moraxella sp.]|nr:hypothetical protein [Moraxella sp.]
MAELERIKIDTEKLRADTMKLQAEAAKIQKESRWFPWLSLAIAIIALIVAILK